MNTLYFTSSRAASFRVHAVLSALGRTASDVALSLRSPSAQLLLVCADQSEHNIRIAPDMSVTGQSSGSDLLKSLLGLS